MSEPKRKFPPFGRHPDIAHGGSVFIYCGSRAYELARPNENRAPSVVYPKDTDPVLYQWPVANLDVIVFQKDEDTMKVSLLVIELLNQGAARVTIAGAADEDGIVPRKVYERPA